MSHPVMINQDLPNVASYAETQRRDKVKVRELVT